jgi:hypothetical protein
MLSLVVEALVVIVNCDRQHLLRMILANHVIVEHFANLFGRRDAVFRFT